VLDTTGAFVTAIPNWSVGETFLLAHGEQFRILEIKTDIADELLDAGFSGVFVVEPVDWSEVAARGSLTQRSPRVDSCSAVRLRGRG
jgi:hypothetical protein